MQNSIEHLIANLPEPIRKVIASIYEEVHYGSQWNDKDLYFALLDLHKWLDDLTYGESILKNIMKAFFINEKFEIIKKRERAHAVMMAGFKITQRTPKEKS